MFQKSVLLFALIVLSTGCISVDRYNKCILKLENRIQTSDLNAILTSDFNDLRENVENSLIARAKILKVIEAIQANGDGALGAKNLKILKEGTSGYMLLRKELIESAQNYECFFYAKDKDLERLKINKLQWAQGAFLSLTASLVLYDNYLLAVAALNKDYRIRNLLNEPDSGFKVEQNDLIEVTHSANSVVKRHRIRAAIKVYEEWMDAWSKADLADQKLNPVKSDPLIKYLNNIIVSSPSFNYVKHWQVFGLLGREIDFLVDITVDSWRDVRLSTANLLSKFFGNTMGLFESRHGKLFADKKLETSIAERLLSGDILLEKTPFRLTDSFIPGHFGHVAIWSGSEAELKVLGLWEHEAIVPFHKELQEKRHVIEALRSGVELNPLAKFLNIDDIAVIRPKESHISKTELKDAITLAFRQLGKEYDFNFDVDTTDKIVCSELAFQAYTTVNFDTTETLGRRTINPDQVAAQATEGKPFELVLFYHDGLLVDPALQLQKMESLMAGQGDDAALLPN